MVKITWEINGRCVTAANFQNALERAMFESVRQQIERRVSAVRCPVHGTAPTIRAKGRSLDRLTFDVSGCCDRAVSVVRAKLQG